MFHRIKGVVAIEEEYVVTVVSVFGRPFVKVKRFALCYRTVVLSVCLSVTMVYCGQTVKWIKMKLGMEVMGLGPGHIVLDGDTAPLPRKGCRLQSPHFSAHFYCGQTARCIKMPLGVEVGLSLGDIVLDGDPAYPHQKGHSPQFSANVRCGQTTGWTKMSPGMKVGLGPGDFVFDGDPAPPPRKKGTAPPNFWPMSIVAKRLDGSRCHLVPR